MNREDISNFNGNLEDYGEKPASVELTPEQKKLSVIGMALQAAIVQFIHEGLFPRDQQVHFMLHLQDFAERLHRGGKLKLPGTHQTLNVDSESGVLFYQALEEALENGHKNFTRLNEEARQVIAQRAEEESEDLLEAKNTTVDPRTLN